MGSSDNNGSTLVTISEEADNSYLTRHLFGNFVFGTGTAAYQVEGGAFSGGRGLSIWDDFTLNSPEKIEDRSNGNVACDTYTRYEEDIRMMKEMGFDAYRFSISWSRILPGGRCCAGINQEGIDYYNDVIDTVIANGMKPYVTLFHFDTPLTLQMEYGGFMSKKIIDDFREYAEICFWEFGDRVKWWTTINEPWTYAVNGYVMGTFPPGIKIPMPELVKAGDESLHQATLSANSGLHTMAVLSGSRHTNLLTTTVAHLPPETTKPKAVLENDQTNSDLHASDVYTVARNMLLAHAEAVNTYRTKFKQLQGGVIGIVLNPSWYLPLDETSKQDMEAVKRGLDFNLGWFLEPLLDGEYPVNMLKHVPANLAHFSHRERERLKNSIDFVGLNYYTTRYVSHVAHQDIRGQGYMADGEYMIDQQKAIGPISTGSSWLYVVPRGIYELLVYMKKTYPKLPPIYITENGYSDANDWKLTATEACADTVRTKYHQDHLAYILKAINEEGVDVRGYFVWSWCDNFEWFAGYKSRFGITYIDYNNNLARHPKNSARWFAKFLKKAKRLRQSDDKSGDLDEIKRARAGTGTGGGITQK